MLHQIAALLLLIPLGSAVDAKAPKISLFSPHAREGIEGLVQIDNVPYERLFFPIGLVCPSVKNRQLLVFDAMNTKGVRSRTELTFKDDSWIAFQFSVSVDSANWKVYPLNLASPHDLKLRDQAIKKMMRIKNDYCDDNGQVLLDYLDLMAGNRDALGVKN